MVGNAKGEASFEPEISFDAIWMLQIYSSVEKKLYFCLPWKRDILRDPMIRREMYLSG